MMENTSQEIKSEETPIEVKRKRGRPRKIIIPIILSFALLLSFVYALPQIDGNPVGMEGTPNSNSVEVDNTNSVSGIEVTEVIEAIDSVNATIIKHDDGNSGSNGNSGSSGGYGGGGWSYEPSMQSINIMPCITNLNTQIMLHLVLQDYKGAILQYADPIHAQCAYVSWRSNRSALIDLISK